MDSSLPLSLEDSVLLELPDVELVPHASVGGHLQKDKILCIIYYMLALYTFKQ